MQDLIRELYQQPYLSIPFKRPAHDRPLSREFYFNGTRPKPGDYYKIGMKSSTHVKRKRERMRLRFYESPVPNSLPVSQRLVNAKGVKIIVQRFRGKSPQYEYWVEPIET